MADLSLRAKRILHAVVAEYLQTGEAVGSRTITRRHNIDLSPATVRNVMADLEDLGLLDQPHTSAGRVPTAAGLRFFIDSLLKVRSLSPQEKQQIRERYATARDPDEVWQHTSKVLAEITRHAGIVLAPLPERQRFQHIEFVPLRDGKVLAVLVTTDGQIENKLFTTDRPVDERQLERIHNYLDTLLGGLTLDEVRERVVAELGKEKNRYDDLVAQALRLSHAALVDARRDADVIVTGSANLVDTGHHKDPAELERMRALLQALEDKELLVRLLDRAMEGPGIQVFLGAETAADALEDASIVAATYGPEDRPLGAIAVVGPKRMNYGKVISIVDFTATLVSGVLHGGE